MIVVLADGEDYDVLSFWFVCVYSDDIPRDSELIAKPGLLFVIFPYHSEIRESEIQGLVDWRHVETLCAHVLALPNIYDVLIIIFTIQNDIKLLVEKFFAILSAQETDFILNFLDEYHTFDDSALLILLNGKSFDLLFRSQSEVELHGLDGVIFVVVSFYGVVVEHVPVLEGGDPVLAQKEIFLFQDEDLAFLAIRENNLELEVLVLNFIHSKHHDMELVLSVQIHDLFGCAPSLLLISFRMILNNIFAS